VQRFLLTIYTGIVTVIIAAAFLGAGALLLFGLILLGGLLLAVLLFALSKEREQ
jgi:cbb3-type cytochrome oxidase subunit 3